MRFLDLGEESGKLGAIGSRSASLINCYAPVQFSVSAGAERATLLSFLVKIARPHAVIRSFGPSKARYLWCGIFQAVGAVNAARTCRTSGAHGK